MIWISGDVTGLERQNILRERRAPEVSVSTIRDAIIPAAQITSRRPLSFKGGVYDGTKLVPSSTFRRGWAGEERNLTEAYDRIPDITNTVDEAIFGGYILAHFGHFMLESMARLWWAVENEFQGPVIFQMIGNEAPQFSRKLFDLAGINALFVSGNECWKIRRLIVPDAALVERLWTDARWALPFCNIRRAVEAPAGAAHNAHLFVSRGTGAATIHGEAEIQDVFEKQGYAILDVGSASLEAQITAFSQARKIVGFVGSGMHNIVYSSQAEHVAYLSRAASVSASFPMIDQCLARYDSTYVYTARSPLPLTGNLSGPYLVDAEECCTMLFRAGLLPNEPRLDPRASIRTRDAYMADWVRLSSHSG